MKIYFKILTAILAVMALNSCYYKTKYELTIESEPYFGNELRFDGYYYTHFAETDTSRYTGVLFFYRNGVIFWGNNFGNDDFEYIDNYFIQGEHESYIDEKDVWSTFKIYNDSLVFETWNPSTLSQGPQPIIHLCKILNDTTFEVYKYRLQSNKEFTEISEIYHFRKFNHKPDSTNKYIE